MTTPSIDLDEAIETVARTLWNEIFESDPDVSPRWDDVEFDDDPIIRNGMRTDAATIVHAVAPVIEAAVRKQIAEEIEQADRRSQRSGLGFHDCAAYAHCADIARGKGNER